MVYDNEVDFWAKTYGGHKGFFAGNSMFSLQTKKLK